MTSASYYLTFHKNIAVVSIIVKFNQKWLKFLIVSYLPDGCPSSTRGSISELAIASPDMVPECSSWTEYNNFVIRYHYHRVSFPARVHDSLLI